MQDDGQDGGSSGGSSGGYVGGLILTAFFFLGVLALVGALLAGAVFAALAMPLTTSLVLGFLAIAGIAGWRAKRRHDRAVRAARRAAGYDDR